MNEQDRQIQLQYEQWLNHQHQVLTQQLKYYETEVQKLRKIRKVRIEYFYVAAFSFFWHFKPYRHVTVKLF